MLSIPEFEWDDNKNREHTRKHGVSFQQATRIFQGRILRKVDDRMDYGEERISALGRADGRVLKVIYALRGKTIRLISARKANRERALHG